MAEVQDDRHHIRLPHNTHRSASKRLRAPRSAVLSQPEDALLAHVARFAAIEDEQSLAMTLDLQPVDDQPISLSDSALICVPSLSSEEVASMTAEELKSFNPAACLYFQPVGSTTVELEVDEPFADVNHEENLGR